ncbi:MBL fold metallo-hydrolase [Arenibaculum pallidiluteum]|uniref:MBL fold metallo-hydrolase n=1 Tax=Arenibaculum pallidiluteum TaxID=2812559 RepID=UPI001A960183|nr:ribonuclease Z [Arenibaculum pallidiluteum]
MEILVLGVGEAADPEFPNASVAVELDGYRVMIDCGHSVPPQLWRMLADPDAVDALVFTHHHPDHCFGLVPALIRWTDDRRTKPLEIVTTGEGWQQLRLMLSAGGIDPEGGLPFALRPRDSREVRQIGPFAVRFAETQHAITNHAVRLEAGGRAFAYSGDGRPTPEALDLYRGCDLLFHECYVAEEDPEMAFHCDAGSVRRLAAATGAAAVRLYHLRQDQRAAVGRAIDGEPRIALAVPGERIRL